MLHLSMKHVSKIKTKTGYRYLYRRVVPARWREHTDKSEYSRTLGHTESEAMKAYDKVHKHYQDLFNAFKPFETVVGNPTFNQVRDGLRSYNAFSNDPKFRLSEDNDTDEWSDGEIEGREALAESIIDQFSRNPITGDYEDVPEYDRKLIKALATGLDKNDYTIEDAFEDYLKIKKEETPDTQHTTCATVVSIDGGREREIGVKEVIRMVPKQKNIV